MRRLIVANGPVVLAECLVELGGRLTRSQTAWRLGMAGNDFQSGLGRRVGRLVDLEGAAWRPPTPFRAGLTKGFGTLGLVAITIFSTRLGCTHGINQRRKHASHQTNLEKIPGRNRFAGRNHHPQSINARYGDRPAGRACGNRNDTGHSRPGNHQI